ncbi:hypothetical protein GCM10009122_59550 [Fulvivirga kasyanovii]|uniref:Secreted protein n=1 Tax=Fulvivirga kasyanovii TaxID=396812 RepID=A0ABW9RTV2_9BACT|nr:hypothetical protein [Fulvivirga kasyanovii]MTI27608.1 hypothetical protein [Fulvivirga kasyanovii]
MVKKRIYPLFSAIQLMLVLLLSFGGYSQSFATGQDFSSEVITSGDDYPSDELWISYPHSADSRHDAESPQYPPLEEDSDDNKTEENFNKINVHGHSLYELTLLQKHLSLRFNFLRLIFIDYQTLVPLYVLFHSWKDFLI